MTQNSNRTLTRCQTLCQHWLSHIPAADPLHAELEQIQDDKAQVTDRFYQDIVFGTAGLRGICGAGTNRMNVYTVGRATQGIANYILSAAQTDETARGVVIAYDCRYHSREFSELAAEILAGNRIPVYLFPSLRPTPELSFAIRQLHALSGINMTASHNPKEYNGYKVYWKDGAQISGAVSDGMQQAIEQLDFFDDFRRLPLEEARAQGLVVMLGEEMDRRYLDYVATMRLHDDAVLDLSVPIVYTPLNGAGSIPMRQAAAERGFTSFHIVPEQEAPDPEFTTVGYPNPEDPKAFRLAEELGRKVDAALLIATDPDSDRMAIEIPDGKGGFTPLDGNTTGALLIAYRAQSMQEAGTLPAKACMIKSIVTGDLGRRICEQYGISVFEALTGFKNICGRIPELQARGYTYFFGYEESIGCAPGEAVRDKDGIAAGMILCELAAWLSHQGRTIAAYLEDLYQQYGYYAQKQVSFVLRGQEGAARIARIMKAFREDPSAVVHAEKVIDYLHGYEDIPASNVLKFILDDHTWFAMRPSGTEPKIKFYYYTVTDNKEKSEAIIRDLAAAVSARAEAVL